MQFRNKYVGLSIVTLLAAMSVAGHGKDKSDKTDSFHYPEMIKVPAGTFLMGTGGDRTPAGPEHLVTLSEDYEIGKYEVSNQEYCDMLNYALEKGYLAGNYKNNEPVVNKEGQPQKLLMLDANFEGIKSEIQYNRRASRFAVEKGKERRPVVYVTWYGAAFYGNVLSEKLGLAKMYDLANWGIDLNPKGPGYRLPTEAEWEYAVRFDESTNKVVRQRFLPWGWPWPMDHNVNDAELQAYANYNYKPGQGSTKDVGSYENGKSKLGLYDMSGNVSEWTQDYFALYKNQVQTNPVDNTSGLYRQRRGGGWLYYANNMLWTVYHTDSNYAYVYYVDFGFRVVKSKAKLNPIVDTPAAVKPK